MEFCVLFACGLCWQWPRILRSTDGFAQVLKSRLMQTRAQGFIIDAPTSRPQVYNQYLTLISNSCSSAQEIILVVLVGSRIDLLSHVRSQMKKLWPQSRPWVVQLTAGDMQTWSRKPGYMLVLEIQPNKNAKGSKDMPHSLDLLKCN